MQITQIEKIQTMLAYIQQNTTVEQYDEFVKRLNMFEDISNWLDYLKSKFKSMVV